MSYKRWIAAWMAIALLLVLFCGFSQADKSVAEKAAYTVGEIIPLSDAEENKELTADRHLFDTQLPDGFQLLDQNGRFALYMENTECNLALVDLNSGAIWYSSPPQRAGIPNITGAGGLDAGSDLLVSYFDSENQSAGSVGSLLGSVRQKTVTVTKIENGVRFDFNFSRSKEGFKIPLTVTLTDDGLLASVLFNEIEEYSSSHIIDISVLPYFGAGTKQDNGWMLLPDGSGAVVNYNSGRQGMSAYYADVYGRDLGLTTLQQANVSEKIALPVFGIQRNGNALLAVIEKGAGSASIEASPSGIDNSVLNEVHASFTYHKSDNIVLAEATWTSKDVQVMAPVKSKQDVVSVRFMPLEKGKKEVSHLAAAYRQYLKQYSGLTDEDDNTVRTYITVYGAVKKEKSFLGIPYTSIQKLTTFSQTDEIASSLIDNGAQNLLIRYKGAMSGGMDDSVPVKASFESGLGGTSGFKSLLQKASSKGYAVYPDIEFIRIGKGRLGWPAFQISAKSVTRTALTESTYKRSVFFADDSRPKIYMLAPNKLSSILGDFLSSSRSLGMKGVSAASLGNVLYSDFNTGKEYDEDMTAEAFGKALQRLKESYGLVSTDTGFDFAAIRADDIWGVPVSDSGYDVSAYRVPFYQMVFSGVRRMASTPLNLSSNYTNQLLMCIETATAPQYVFTYSDTSELENTSYDDLISTKYSDWQDKALKAYSQYTAVFSQIPDRTITGYRVIGDKVRETSYADGTLVYVNYTDDTAKADQVQVPAKGYTVVQNGQVLVSSSVTES